VYQTKLCKLSLVGGLSLYKVRGWLAYLFSSHSSYSGLSWSNVDLGMQGQKQLKGLWEMRSRLGWVCLAEGDTKIQFQIGMFGFCLRGHRGIWWCGHVLWDELGDTRLEMEGKKKQCILSLVISFLWYFLLHRLMPEGEREPFLCSVLFFFWERYLRLLIVLGLSTAAAVG